MQVYTFTKLHTYEGIIFILRMIVLKLLSFSFSISNAITISAMLLRLLSLINLG